VFQLCKYLSNRHDVTLLSYADEPDLANLDPFRERIGGVHVVERPHSSGRSKRLAQLASIVSFSPYQGQDLYSVKMQSAIDKLLSNGGFDIIQIESSQMMGFRYPSSAAVVLDEHNIEYELLERVKHGERSVLRRIYNHVEYRKFRPVEQRSWRAADGCVVTSDRERLIVSAQAPSTPVMVVPNGVDADFFSPSGLDIQPNTLVFNGLMAYRPNLDAATYLVQEIMPAVERLRPGASLIIVGDGDRSDLESLRRPNVVVTGKVPDVRPYLEQAAVVVVPIRMGGGTRLKVVEALAMGKAVVSTSLGCEGIRVRDGEHLLIAEDAKAFVSSIELLLSDPERRTALGRAGRSLVVEEYSWERAGSCLEALFSQVTENATGVPRSGES
jgi:glycosyltransferase involved in cell wall biosynthesis